MTQTKQIKTTELKVGNIVHFYGARFEVLFTAIQKATDNDACKKDVLWSKAKWLDGNEIGGYFGRNCEDWNFQGNDLATVNIEV
jgi:hypothetical protein